MNKIHYQFLSFLLTIIGYMTLSISFPILNKVALQLQVDYSQTQYGLSLLFFMFSLSAICLGGLADMYGAFKVLKYAQLISIMGLMILSFSYNMTTFIVGCFLTGGGTGSYSSNARALLSRHSTQPSQIKKAFAIMTILVVIAPLLTSYIASSVSPYSWRFAYAVMAALEILLLVYAYWVLKHESNYGHKKFILLWQGFHYCIRHKRFLVCMLASGTSFSVFIQLFMTNASRLFISNYAISLEHFNLIILALSIFYVFGALCFLNFNKNLSSKRIVTAGMGMFFLGAIIFSLTSSLTQIILGISGICLALGFMTPFFTSHGMTVIKKNHGSAAALFTFSMACVSGLWSLFQANLMLGVKDFVTMGVWISGGIIFIVCCLIINAKID